MKQHKREKKSTKNGLITFFSCDRYILQLCNYANTYTLYNIIFLGIQKIIKSN